MKASYLSRGVWTAFALLSPGCLTALTPHASSDRPLTIIQTFDPEVRRSFDQILPTYGEVRVVINVDDSGKLVDWLPVSYSHPEYYRAAVDALKEWQYQPAQRAGEPIGVRQVLVFNFESRGQVVSLTPMETVNALLGDTMNRSGVKCIYRGGELDTPPQPIKQVQPLWVPAMATLPPGAGVMIDFYIDDTGHPRMATVSDYTDPTIAITAVRALEQWQFSVPTYRGRPVMTHAAQWFAFTSAHTQPPG